MTGNDRFEHVLRGSGVTVRVFDDYQTLSRAAAEIVDETVRANPTAAITLPTGETPRGMYGELVRRITSGDLDFSQVNFFCLDDYLGAAIDEPASLTGWLHEVFLAPANLHGDHIHFVPTTAADPDAAAAAYDAAIRSHGGFQLSVLGLGPNGHLGFNEPGSPGDSRTRVVDLTAESRKQNAKYYEGNPTIPTHAMTIGIGTLLESASIVVIVSGDSKAEILKRSLEGPITTDVPGSLLQSVGSRVIVLADREAAAMLS